MTAIESHQHYALDDRIVAAEPTQAGECGSMPPHDGTAR